MNIYLVEVDNNEVLAPLPEKSEVYQSALAIIPEIEAGRLDI